MSEDLKELNENIAKLTAIVAEKGLGGLNRDEIVKAFTDALVARDQAAAEAEIIHRGEEPPHTEELRFANVKGRYERVAKQFAEGGYATVNGTKVLPIDLLMAERLMTKAKAAEQKDAKAPSEDLTAIVKAMSSTGVGTGAELVPENLAATIWEDMFVASKVFADLPEQPMTSDPMDVGTMGTMTFAKGTQNIAGTAQDLTTTLPKLTTTELLAEVNWSYNLDEDAVVGMMPSIRMEAERAGAEYMDAFALNADATNAATGNINSDDGDPDDTSYYLSNGQDGIRHLFLVDATGQGSNVAAALDDSKMAVILAKLGKYGLDLPNLRIVPDVQTYLSMLSLASVKTVDVYGAAATVATGELAKYRGITVIPSGVMPTTEADGKVSTTGSNNTKGQLAVYNRMMWRRGSRRGLTIEIDRSIQKRQMILVVSFRIAVGCREATRSTAKHTAGGYNITI